MKHHPRIIPPISDNSRSTALVALLTTLQEPGTSDNTTEVVEAELVDDRTTVFSTLSPDIASAVLDAFLDDSGRLVPAKSSDTGLLINEDSAARMRRAQALDNLRANAWADQTLRNYGAGLRAWRAWCDREGVSALPFSPQLVCDHLIDYGFVWDDGATFDVLGSPQGRVSMGAIEMRLAALNKSAEFIGVPRPGDNEGLRQLIRGMRRTLLTAPENQKAALDHDLLLRCLSATTGRTLLTARLRVAVLLRVRADATAGQIARLTWPDVESTASGVALTVPPATRYEAAKTIHYRRHTSNPLVCLATALDELRGITTASEARLTFVVSHPNGEPLTRQAVHRMIVKALPAGRGWEDKTMPDRELARVLNAKCPATPTETARDRALLLTGFWGALRRSNLAALNWRDLVDHCEDGIEVILRRSKTDQEGRGDSVFAPHGETSGVIPSPAEALREWRTKLTDALGRPPHDDEPVFAALTPAGTIKFSQAGHPVRLGGDGINEVVQRLTTASGLASKRLDGERHPYGAHSLRAGFVTEGAQQGLSITDIQSVTKHVNVDVLIRYVRQANAKKKNGSRKLFDQLGK